MVDGLNGWQTLDPPWQRKDEFIQNMILKKKQTVEQAQPTPTVTIPTATDTKTTAKPAAVTLDTVFLEVATDKTLWVYDFATRAWLKKSDLSSLLQTAELANNPERQARLNKAAQKQALYINSVNAYGALLDKHIQFMKVNGLNAMVVDFKDDNGYITYNSKLELGAKLKCVLNRIKIEELVQKARDNGIYLVGRIVTFKDKSMHKYENYKYAIWNVKTNGAWDNTKEFWADPYSPFVWEYNIDLAKELENAGVDEIQFDYIRFPTDGDVQNIAYRYKLPEMNKIDALEAGT
jgi:hypothetical protein